MTLLERELLREKFESVTRETYGRDNYGRDGDNYRVRIIQAMWIGVKFGFKCGESTVKNESEE